MYPVAQKVLNSSLDMSVRLTQPAQKKSVGSFRG